MFSKLRILGTGLLVICANPAEGAEGTTLKSLKEDVKILKRDFRANNRTLFGNHRTLKESLASVQANSSVRLDTMDGFLRHVEDRVSKLEGSRRIPGPRGPKGEKGSPGEKGEKGNPGITERTLKTLLSDVKAVKTLRNERSKTLERSSKRTVQFPSRTLEKSESPSRGLALAAALSGLSSISTRETPVSLSFSVGEYEYQPAYAMGIATRLNDRVLIRSGFSLNPSGEHAGNLSVTIGF